MLAPEEEAGDAHSLAPFALAQIVLYSCARCVSALLPRAEVKPDYPAKKPIPTDSKSFEIFAALVWGCVMWLFENRRVRLQNGLVNSMDCECEAPML